MKPQTYTRDELRAELEAAGIPLLYRIKVTPK